MAVILLLMFQLVLSVSAYGDVGHGLGYRPPKSRLSIERQTETSHARTLLTARQSLSLPPKWDSRDEGWVTDVRDQGKVGSCWAFAACATIETQLLKTGRGEWDLSEKNMVNLHGFETGFDDGGNDYFALAYLLRWGGAVAETNDVYVGTTSEWTPSSPLMPALHIQNVVWIPGRSSVYDNDTLKRAIKNYGAVSTTMYWGEPYVTTSNCYCNTEKECNHAITVVGWDDSYPAGNFKPAPRGNGAWLIKNSWGTDSGDRGYYHVSYYDVNFAYWDGSVFIPATEDENYDAVYGYDILGPIEITDDNEENTLEAAVFTSAWNEEIAAVGVYSNIDSNRYAVSVYTNVVRTTSTDSPDPLAGGALACMFSGTLETPGFTTLHLPEAVRIADGTNFAVVYEQKGAVHPHLLSCSASYSDGTELSVVTAEPGWTYWGKIASGATNWTDLAVYAPCPGSITCLKAYTRSTLAAADKPSECEDGTGTLEWLAETNATLYAETAGTFGAFAGLVGANGRSLYASWLAGFDPASADDCELVVSISVTNNIPVLDWKPNLGQSSRKYTVYGTESLSPQSWQPVEDLATTPARYFKVGISQQ